VFVCIAPAGVVHQLLEQLSPRDPLSSLVALQLLQVSVRCTTTGAAAVAAAAVLYNHSFSHRFHRQ
jgi:hypothetical protein